MSLKAEKNELSIYDFIATEVQILDNQLIVTLDDSRKIMVPLSYYAALESADAAAVRDEGGPRRPAGVSSAQRQRRSPP